MSIIQLLQENLYEDEDNPVVDLTPESGETSASSNKEHINKEFIVKLINFIDSRFPAYGEFDDKILNEIRKYIDQSDNKEVLKIKSKIHQVILNEKKRFLDKLYIKVSKILVPKKK